jgi:hypothetical protein
MTTNQRATCLPTTLLEVGPKRPWRTAFRDAFCVQRIVLNGERQIYKLNRKTLMQIHGRTSRMLAKPYRR